MWGDFVNVALRADRLGAKDARSIDKRTEKQHALLKQGAISFAPNVHCTAVDRIGSAAVGITQTGPNCVQSSHLWLRAKDSRAILEGKTGFRQTEWQTGIELQQGRHHAPSLT
jgi:hypothetical protein